MLFLATSWVYKLFNTRAPSKGHHSHIVISENASNFLDEMKGIYRNK